MSTDAIDFTFSVRQTLRTGLDVARRKALAIIALALASRFVASQGAAGIMTFASTLGVSLAPIEGALVFFGSLVLMWFAVVPLTIQAIEARGLGEPSGAVLDRLWHDASVHYRALSLRTVIRGLGLLLVTYGLVGVLFLSVLVAPAIIVACVALLVALVSLRWSVALPAMIMESLRVLESLRRSWYLTRSQVWRLLGLSILTTAIVAALGALLALGFGLVFGGGDVLTAVAFFVGQTVALVFAAPITSACYYYLRRD